MLSGAPSTAWSLATRRPPLEAARAAGNVLLPAERPAAALLAAGAAAHGALSLLWAAATGAVAARARRPVLAGAGCGLAIAALDLGLVAHGLARRRMALVRALPVGPQVADHVAFGALVGLTVRNRRRARAAERGRGRPASSLSPAPARPRPHSQCGERER